MADEKAAQCYSLAKHVEQIDCALHDLKTTVLPKKEMRHFNGVGMSLYSLQGSAKSIGSALPEVKAVAGKLARRARDLGEIVKQISTEPVPPVIAEFIRDDLGALWDHQRILLHASEKACLRPGAPEPEKITESFRPIPPDVKKAAAKIRKEIDRKIAKRNREYQREINRAMRKSRKKRGK